MGVCTRSSETLFTKWYYENYKWGKMIVFGPSLNFTDGYFCKVQESSSVNCFHLNCEIELLTHMNLCEQGGLEGRDHVCVMLCVCPAVLPVWAHLLLWKKDGSTKRMNAVSMDWLSCVCLPLCACVCVCVSLGSRLREWESGRGTDQFPFYCGRAETWDAWPPVTQIHSSFLLCSSSLAKWRNIRWRERQKRTDEREWVEEEGKGDGVGSLLIKEKKKSEKQRRMEIRGLLWGHFMNYTWVLMRALCAYKEYIRMESLRYFHSFVCVL